MLSVRACRPIDLVAAALIAIGVAAPASALDIRVDGFDQAVAEATLGNDALAAHYRETGFAPIWTGEGAAFTARRAALIAAMEAAPLHGLPARRHDAAALRGRLAGIRSDRDLGRAEVDMSRAFLRVARDLSAGTLDPRTVVGGIKREPASPDPAALLRRFVRAEPVPFLRDLAPRRPEYARLLKARLGLEAVVAVGGWGAEAPAGKLRQGDAGDAVVSLRNRLIRMGYLAPHAGRAYDARMRRAVEAVQSAHGLKVDGIYGEGTRAAMNVPAAERLGQVLVALERERWLDDDLGRRHVWVNLTDFSAAIVDNDTVTFRTRSVIGKDTPDRQSPEFSDEMEHMVINPSWYVPRSIATKEYLPKLRKNPWAVQHLQITDSRGRTVNRGRTNFANYSPGNFPYSMRQPPGSDNALGQVKFMFPNKYNIYLHDTPAKSLFGREVRAFSHGCIRLNDPAEFAHTLLAAQVDDPVSFYDGKRRTGAEARVNLDAPVPVHIVYRTAFTDARGGLHFRADIYGRDGRIADALREAGVAFPGAGS